MAGRVFVITGNSGTGIGASLGKYIAFSGRVRDVPRVIKVIKVEDYVKPVAEERLRKAMPELSPSWWAVLQLPKRELAKVWKQGFENAMVELNKARDAGHDVFLTLHACWYHIRFREFISVVESSLLRDAMPSLVVTLIDDIYDVGARLSAESELLSDPRHTDALIDRVLKLLLILAWRAYEVSLSDRLAATCEVPHYVFAVKHPLKTFGEVPEQRKHTLYISHPITDVRNAWNDGGQTASDKADAAVAQVNAMTRKLRGEFAVFEPTAIDELRFHSATLGRRWPLTASEEDLLWVPPPKDSSETWQSLPESPDGGGLVDVLGVEITKQIAARDYKLVDQTQCLAAYRPFPSGRMATGVSRELGYYAMLHRLGTRSKPAQVLHPPSDEIERVRWCVGNAVLQFMAREGYKVPNGDLEAFETAGLPQIALGDVAKLTEAEIGARVGKQLDKYGIKLQDVRMGSGALTPEPPGVVEEAAVHLGRMIKAEIARCYLDELEVAGSLRIDRANNVSAEVFADRFIERYLAGQ